MPASNKDPLNRVVTYVDDIMAIVTAKTKSELELKLNAKSRSLEKFLDANNLVINSKKTKFLIHSFENNSFLHMPIRINTGKEIFGPSEYVKLLGIKISGDLSWGQHIVYQNLPLLTNRSQIF